MARHGCTLSRNCVFYLTCLERNFAGLNFSAYVQCNFNAVTNENKSARNRYDRQHSAGNILPQKKMTAAGQDQGG